MTPQEQKAIRERAAGIGAITLRLRLTADPQSAALEAFCRDLAALAPGGTLVVVGHDRTNATAGVGGPADPLVLFSPEDAVADLAGAQGVTVVSAARRQRDVPGAARQAIDAVVVARRVE